MILPAILGFGLIIASCNTDSQSRQNSDQRNDNKTEMREGVSDTSGFSQDNTNRIKDNENMNDQSGTRSKDNDRR